MEIETVQENKEEEIKIISKKRKVLSKILMIGLLGLSIVGIILFSRYLIIMGGAF